MKIATAKLVIVSLLLGCTAMSNFAGGIFQQISQGGYHALAIATNGTLWSWGNNDYGQLGDSRFGILSASQVGTDTNWQTVCAGEYHSLAIKTDGTLWAWGNNGSGQLGDGSTSNSATPIQIGTDTNWSMLGAGQSHSVATKTDGTLWAWGYNLFGQLGDGTTTDKHIPTQIGTDTDWHSIAVGLDHTVGIKTNGTLWTWGKNSNGQLGDGTTTSTNSPEQIGSDTDWATAAGGNVQTLATKTDQTLWAWGWDVIADGPGLQFAEVLTPQQRFQVQGFAAGGYHNVELIGGVMYGWGYDAYSMGLEDTWVPQDHPSSELVVYPWPYTDHGPWSAASAGLNNVLALRSDGTAWECGQNNFGQLANGTFNPQNSGLTKVLLTANVAIAGPLSQTYDGTAKSVSTTTDRPGLNVVVTYNGSTNAPTDAGSYAVVATVQDADYFGYTNGTLVIAQAVAPIVLTNLVQYYNGTAKSISAITTPAGLNVGITYNGSPNPPTNLGTYAVVGTINDVNYQGTALGNLIITNIPISLAGGTYTGLFFQSNNITLQSSGYFTMNVQPTWKIGGRIFINGGSYPLSGSFDTHTASANISVPAGSSTLAMSVQLFTDGTSETVVGTVSDGVWTASLSGNKKYYSTTVLCPLAGSYAMTLLGTGDGTSAPNYGTRAVLKVKSNGTVSISGQLADDAPIAQSPVISKAGQVPFYVKLYKGAGSVIGWITFTNATEYRLTGEIGWLQNGPSGKFYATGFTNTMTAYGSIRQ